MLNIRISIVIVVLLMLSCQKKHNKTNDKSAIAKAYDQYLYKEQLNHSKNSNQADSINMINDQINDWLTNQILAENAKKQLPANIKNELDKKVESYRNELYTFAYEREITRQQMDTVLADSVIEKYYTNYLTEYLLEEPYLRFIYVKCDRESYVEEVESWMKDSIDLYNLEDFCKEELQACHLYPEKWVSLKQFKSRLSGVNLDWNTVKSGEAYIKRKEGNVHYIIRILDYKGEKQPAPLSFVKNDIQTILLNKKRVDFFNSLKIDLLQSELDKGKVKILE